MMPKGGKSKMCLLKVAKGGLVAAAICLLVGGCAAPPVKKKESPPAKREAAERPAAPSGDQIAGRIEEDDREMLRVFRLADEAYRRGDLDAASAGFAAFASRYPESVRADDAHFMLGEIALGRNDLGAAIGHFQKIIADYVGADLFGEAKFRLAFAYFKKENYNDAFQLLSSLLEGPLDRRRRNMVMTTAAECLFNLGQKKESLLWYAKALGENPEEESAVSIKKQIALILERHLDAGAVEREAASSDSEFVRQYAKYALIARIVDEERYEEARTEAEKYLKTDLLEEVRVKTADLLQVISERMDVQSDRIGCILPLSGSYGAYGQKILKAIQLAAGVFSAGDGRTINLVIKDSHGEPEKAASAVDELVDKDKVIAVIGPLLGSEAESAALRAQERGLPMIALSQKMGLPETGNFVFRNSLTSRMQTQALADYFIRELSIRRFAILYPTDLYGETLMNRFWNDVLLRGGEVVGIAGYDKNQYDFGKEIKTLVGMERVDEKSEKKKEEHEKIRPVIDFEAVFIADSYDRAAMIAPQLVFNDINNVRLLGPNSWNSPKLVEMGGDYVEGAVFAEGFYAQSRYAPAGEFAAAFRTTFEEEPGTLEAQAYDAARMVVDVIRRDEAKSRVEMRDALLLVSGFMGATGKTSVTSSGDVEKELVLLTVRRGEIVEVERPGAAPPATQEPVTQEPAPQSAD